MLSVEEAWARVREATHPLPASACLLRDGLGRVLAEDVVSDIDSPPYDKSIVDGYALRGADLAAGRGTLTVVEQVTAGRVATRGIAPGEAIQIMTGAPLPAGADSVVMLEQATLQGAGDRFPHRVLLVDPRFTPGQNVLRRAVSMARGGQVLRAGIRLGAAQIGLLAEVGRTHVRVVPPPRVAVLPTGDELVAPDVVPQPGQIRNSNGPMLLAAVAAAGAVPVDLGVARDTRDDLQTRIARGLECEVLVLSGGVSAGVLDLVPAVLAELGVEQVFHKIHFKPGKPLWFGRRARAQARDCLVFGLPGNPVSSLVCFELFVRLALEGLAGSDHRPQPRRGRLAAAFVHRGDRPTWCPARVAHWHQPLPEVELLAWQGSGDLYTLAQANALVAFAAGTHDYQPNDEVAVWPLRL